MAKNLSNWDPENQQFWESEGKAIAKRNLWISIPSLILFTGIVLILASLRIRKLEISYGSE